MSRVWKIKTSNGLCLSQSQTSSNEASFAFAQTAQCATISFPKLISQEEGKADLPSKCFEGSFACRATLALHRYHRNEAIQSRGRPLQETPPRESPLSSSAAAASKAAFHRVLSYSLGNRLGFDTSFPCLI